MSPQHVTSLWPIIISEMVQVFLHIEQELSTDTEEFRYVVIDVSLYMYVTFNLTFKSYIVTTFSWSRRI